MTSKRSVAGMIAESVAKGMLRDESLEDTLDMKNDSGYLKAKAALFIGRFSKEILNERLRQIDKFHNQSYLPDKSESIGDFVPNEHEAKAVCDTVFRFKKGTWFHIHFEEFCEAWCASNPQDMRKELVQLIATLTAHVQAMDEREGK
jgi:hypothetical protein